MNQYYHNKTQYNDISIFMIFKIHIMNNIVKKKYNRLLSSLKFFSWDSFIKYIYIIINLTIFKYYIIIINISLLIIIYFCT